jgi:hypothetical protein
MIQQMDAGVRRAVGKDKEATAGKGEGVQERPHHLIENK